jgi:hypothetical protein
MDAGLELGNARALLLAEPASQVLAGSLLPVGSMQKSPAMPAVVLLHEF